MFPFANEKIQHSMQIFLKKLTTDRYLLKHLQKFNSLNSKYKQNIKHYLNRINHFSIKLTF